MQRKPVDVGNGRVCASFGIDAAWLSVSVPHPTIGMVELVGGTPFDAALDGDPAAVRDHRTRLCEADSSFLRASAVKAELTGIDGTPRWRVQGPSWDSEVTVVAAPGHRAVTQLWRIQPHAAGGVRLVFAGRIDRPSYAEITPIGPRPPTLGPNQQHASGPRLTVTAPGTVPLVSAVVTADVDGSDTAEWSTTDADPELSVGWDGATAPVELRVTVTLDVDAEPVPADAGPLIPRPTHQTAGRDVLAGVTDGALRYVLECTAIDLDESHCCILTDHRLLPLSWTRDAYYQGALILACADDAPAGVDRVERHLAWLWGPGRDADGVWQRSHFTTGQVKDPAYQADQQLYPLLELVDFRRTTGRWPGGHRDWGELVRTVWSRLPRDPNRLLPGEENPADDPSTLPYLLSSQLLLVYTARRLAEWEAELGLADLGFSSDADATMAAVQAAFTGVGPAGPQWAYESDGRRGRRLYHDANDVPTALAPMWGLCEPDDPWWQGTMRFAFSADNPGFVTGRHAGLGSAHTPGVWPLGDAQQWASAMVTGDVESAGRVLDRLRFVVSDDGMLPETYHPDTGGWMARPWFAWPGALLGVLDRSLRARAGPWATEANR